MYLFYTFEFTYYIPNLLFFIEYLFILIWKNVIICISIAFEIDYMGLLQKFSLLLAFNGVSEFISNLRVEVHQ